MPSGNFPIIIVHFYLDTKTETLDLAENNQQGTGKVEIMSANNRGKLIKLAMLIRKFVYSNVDNSGTLDLTKIFRPYVSPPLEVNPFEMFGKDSQKGWKRKYKSQDLLP